MPDLFEIIDAGFEAAERGGDRSLIWRHPTLDGREATVLGTRLCIGPPGAAASGDAYRYATPMGAILGAARWIDAGCRHEPDRWRNHPTTGRTRADGVAQTGERAWVCPRHPDRLPMFARGRLFCPSCELNLSDAVRVAWPPRDGA